MIFHSITHCSALKATPPDVVLNGPIMPQSKLAKNWCSGLSRVQETVSAKDLYTGRGYQALVSKGSPKSEAFNRVCWARPCRLLLRQ